MARKKAPQKPEGIAAEVGDCPVCDGTGVRPIDAEDVSSHECLRCRGKGQVLRIIGQAYSPDEDDEESC